ncbi:MULTISPECIES: Nramp family divalent metal transporter [Leeuwenhoekiella]|jgi:Mn2+/Fe2+ NRAMP family transporter|uniref:Mn2+/Fe2+ transporter, NRAMP family protein n=1 Tax=Leeuwenhoekiella blandensis (strain CECT 7118 / CCUG 51940 / KCTC 22103 / MED217) TaxID=398720 RepID=A3XNN3_LEEBM|nr:MULTISPECIES: Nramp family divalent metal transporter [Leeuwenhoekiella]EAQ48838.1 Mn2+/Fe2+ transporter, NRAMP family protein [Leeuwenhoekiella blandensis MED217]MAO43171.1 divalent metal cation transporter [Leeuwenhoekiella sp.]|tara:strand:- start:3574 stop:4797 length:1224 start_codon:yes stop_codon:yes gene_type:complete
MRNPFKNIGPGALVAAAFIGPGTVTVCTLAGIQFGFSLLWAMTLSIIATIILQETASRIGLVSQKGLSQVLRDELPAGILRKSVLGLVLAAIVVGNAAYEGGNISGGVLGLQALGSTGILEVAGYAINGYSLLIGAIAFILLYIGNYKVLEKVFLLLVILMSLSFVITAILTGPQLLMVLKGALIPQFPDGSILMIVALVGTTVVPYNLFLHASLVNQKWKDRSELSAAKKDTIVAVILGGLVSMSVIIAAAAITGQEVDGASGLAQSLEPLYGSAARYCIGLGLFAAGITSAITAPLAAAYVAQGCLNLGGDLKSRNFRLVWMLVLVLGVGVATFGIKPIEIIQFAQVANGILLPVIAGILIWLANRSTLLGNYQNSKLKNIISVCILIVTLILGARAILSVFGLL